MENHQEEQGENLKEAKKSSYSIGKSGEEAAIDYLRKKKYKIIERGFRLLRGEIDIIAYDQKTLVFVEVKTRKSRDFGYPEESVTRSKQQQIRKIAQGFLAKKNMKDVECRFDVLSLFFTEKEGYKVDHIQNAF
jgi:putative endonuclease